MGFEDSTAKCAGWYSKLCSLVHLSVQGYTDRCSKLLQFWECFCGVGIVQMLAGIGLCKNVLMWCKCSKLNNCS